MEQREHFLGKPRELFDGSFFFFSFLFILETHNVKIGVLL